MSDAYFVTRTDTGVGKTLVAAALVRWLAQQGRRVVGLKPVASGARRGNGGLRNDDAVALAAESTVRLPYDLTNPYCFEPATAPHLAAADVGRTIDIPALVDWYREATAGAEVAIVEGSRGLPFFAPGSRSRQDPLVMPATNGHRAPTFQCEAVATIDSANKLCASVSRSWSASDATAPCRPRHPGKFAQQATKAMMHPDVTRLRRSLNGEKLAIGVDRLDYSKGLVNRIKAFDRMWSLHPYLKRSVSLLQIATPSRGAIEAYGNLASEVAKLVTDVNGVHGEVDWTPIRYLNKGFGQGVLAGLYRTAQVGVVTPLQDGMNLVAKEYVVAQDAADPGVLVLSRFAGAARELNEALIVNPVDVDALAESLHEALVMPLDERRKQHQ